MKLSGSMLSVGDDLEALSGPRTFDNLHESKDQVNESSAAFVPNVIGQNIRGVLVKAGGEAVL
jgi:hypothetical protein